MLITILMLSLWQYKGELYKRSFETATTAYYEGSDLKTVINEERDKIKANHPITIGLASLGYTTLVRKDFRFTSKSLSLLPNTVTSYNYNMKTHSGSININWSF